MISLRPEIVLEIKNFHLTNTYLGALLATVMILLFSFVFKNKIKEIPSRCQSLLEIVFENFYNFWANLTGVKNLKIFAPIT